MASEREYKVSVSVTNRRFEIIWECSPDELSTKLASIQPMLTATGLYSTQPSDVDIRVEDRGRAKLE
jgi:hypothetical protein